MKRSALCLVVYVLCLATLGTSLAAEASAGPAALPTPAAPTSSLVVAAQPKAVMYRLWHYHGKQGWKHKPNENPNASHKALHGKGKADNRTHVHPDYWNENIKAVALKTNTMLFTVTIDDPNIKPAPNPTPTLPPFCLHECNGGWIYKTSGTDYQKLYEDEVALYSGIECRDPSEACDANQNPPKYFTICTPGTTLGDGTKCCLSKPMPPQPEPVCFPPIVIEPTRQKHCILGGLLRGRRGMTFGCCP